MMNRISAIRGVHVLLFIAILLGIDGARLAWLQLGFGSSHAASGTLIKHAVLQRSDALLLDRGRGQFRDRHGRLLTGVSVQSLAAFPDDGLTRGSPQDMQLLAASLGVEQEALDEWLTKLREPQVWKEAHSTRALSLSKAQVEAVEAVKLLGVAVLPYRNRYPAEITPIHAIGYISQHPERIRLLNEKELSSHPMSITNAIGGAGLEKSMDRLLQGIAPTIVSQVTDATRRPLEGLGLRITAPDNPHFPLQVTTTLDLDIQQMVEKIMDKHGISKGATVVLDVNNADILTMVSFPKLNPYQIGAEQTDERNHALIGAPPGSIFKTVTLAAALESGVTTWDEEFRCTGHYGKYGLKCWREEGHGRITLKEAFAESCNVVFAQLAERMDPAWLQITGERMGLARAMGWHTEKFTDEKPLRLLEEEEAGAIFLNRTTAMDGGVRTGTGIGQRDVRVTPLQAANMVVSILHNGHVYAPRLVKNIRYADGGLMTSFPVQTSRSKYGEIEPNTAELLREGMLSVVQEGTASKALKESLWPLAGKSGTAELAGKQMARNDQWFIGYGPANEHPHYAIAVLIEDQPAGLRNRAAAVFGDIMDELHRHEQKTLLAAEQEGER
jgi:cell division protein FtsI/penicillin-binding protein 2